MTVYAVQSPRRRVGNDIVPKYDLSPAMAYGEIVELLSPTAKPFNPAPIVEELYIKLEEFNSDDYIICIGNPILLSMAVTIAADINEGKVRLLQWHGHRNEYTPVDLDLGFSTE